MDLLKNTDLETPKIPLELELNDETTPISSDTNTVSIKKDLEPRFLTVKDVLSLDKEEMGVEILRRWIMITKIAMENLKFKSQVERRKRGWFTIEKIFFFDSISKKYISRALIGEEKKEIYSKINDGYGFLCEKGYLKIISYHPKFLTEGIDFFLELCKKGEVYLYEQYSDDIDRGKKSYDDERNNMRRKGRRTITEKK